VKRVDLHYKSRSCQRWLLHDSDSDFRAEKDEPFLSWHGRSRPLN